MRVIGFAGWSGAGKTTLVAKVLPRILGRGLRASTVKHAHHSFDMDRPGKDSHTHRLAGATEVLISSSGRWALIHELRGAQEPLLGMLLAKLTPVDLVLIEGFKRGRHPKVEVYRAAVGKPLLHPEDPYIVAVVSDAALPDAPIPVVGFGALEAIVDLLLANAVPVEAIIGLDRGA